MLNIFIEGIQGMGKSTLLQAIAQRRSDLKVCHEGDYSPVELAWCAKMTQQEYVEVLERYSDIRDEIEEKTFREENDYIVTYTKILTDIPGFHKDLERFEIYNGRTGLQNLKETILTRYEKFQGSGYLFECAFMQNIVEDLILFHQLSDDEIVRFYQKLYNKVRKENFILLYLYSDDIEKSTRIIRKERSDSQGNEMWYPLMLEYLVNSPYGKQHNYKDFEDLVMHLQHRQQVELRIINEVVKERAVIIPANQWNVEQLMELIEEKCRKE